MSKWRRFELLLPLQLNDGRIVPDEEVGEAVDEIAERFSAASLETQRIQGRWHQAGILYRDELLRVFVDTPDNVENRQWMRRHKARWKERLQQLADRVRAMSRLWKCLLAAPVMVMALFLMGGGMAGSEGDSLAWLNVITLPGVAVFAAAMLWVMQKKATG